MYTWMMFSLSAVQFALYQALPTSLTPIQIPKRVSALVQGA